MGVHGSPEYVQTLLEEAENLNDDIEEELKACLQVRLERQEGSRYFVTSRNAGRLFFLAPHAVTFLESLSLIKQLNGLEKDVLHNLKSDIDLALLKVDGLLFDQIYADLMCILKSKIRRKTYLDMNAHYLELLKHLQLLAAHPRLGLDHTIQVFVSEERIYGRMAKVNHRLHKN